MAEGEAPSVGQSVNEHEGAVLAMLSHAQPLNRYQLLRAFQMAPVGTLNTSKGSLYPLVRRLLQRGWIEAVVDQDSDSVERLRLTGEGEKVLKAWLTDFGADHAKAYDPLELRVLALSHLPFGERLRWLAHAKRTLQAEKAALAGSEFFAGSQFGALMHAASLAVIDAKIEWLDSALLVVAEDGPPIAS